MSKHEKWMVEDYELMTVVPVEGFLAVYAEESKVHPGKFVLVPSKLDAVGVAKVVSYDRVATGNGDSEIVPGSVEDSTAVVGLQLHGGYWHICEDDENFSGQCRVGDDIKEVTGHLNTKYYDLIVEE